MSDRLHAGSTAELEAAGYLVVGHAGREILVVSEGGAYYALDNECPHLGSPLQRGTVAHGRITCAWHRAEFDLATGKSLSLFAPDLTCFTVLVERGELYVVVGHDRQPRR